MNEWINFITYIPPVKPEGKARGCILRRSIVFNPLGDDSPVRMWAFIPLLVEWELGLNNHRWFCCFSKRTLFGVHSPCSHRCVVRWGGHVWCPCMYCLCLACRVSLSTRASVQSLTTANQRRTYFKFQLYVVDPSHQKPVLILPNGLSKPRERAHDRNLISAVGRIRTTTSWSTVQRVTTGLSPLSVVFTL